jgi:hypothetical protein
MKRRDDAERAAIEHAQHEFRRWHRPQPDFAGLRRAARALLAQLPDVDDFEAPGTMHLMTVLQAQPPHAAKADVLAELQRLRDTLQRIDAATVPVKGVRDDDAANWIAQAADAWVEFTGTLPSSGDRSRFLQALQAHADADMPKVNRDQLRDVLPRWRAFRG